MGWAQFEDLIDSTAWNIVKKHIASIKVGETFTLDYCKIFPGVLFPRFEYLHDYLIPYNVLEKIDTERYKKLKEIPDEEEKDLQK